MSKMLSSIGVAAFACASLSWVHPASAQNAPGEDPVQINGRVLIQGLPTAAATRSGYITASTGMPAWQKAKMSRYEAKAYSGDTTGIQTDKDVVSTVNTNGLKTTCTQSILPATTTTGTGLGKGADQVVVLRGDVVNICN